MKRGNGGNGDLEEGDGLGSVEEGNGAGTGGEKGETWKRGGGNGVRFDGGSGVGSDGVEEEVENVLHDLGVQE